MDDTNSTARSTFVSVIIVQTVCVLSILAGVFTVKLISPETHKKIYDFYSDKICEQTDISEISRYFEDAV